MVEADLTTLIAAPIITGAISLVVIWITGVKKSVSLQLLGSADIARLKEDLVELKDRLNHACDRLDKHDSKLELHDYRLDRLDKRENGSK